MKDRIKQIIEREEMTQSQFADFIGVNRPTLSHILAGRNNPSMEVVMKIHQSFPKINILWLIDGKGSYEGDAVAEYPAGSLREDREADAPDATVDERQSTFLSPYPNNKEENGEEAKDTTDTHFYQGELFAENAVFSSKSAGGEKKRKEKVLQPPKMSDYQTGYQPLNSVQKMQRKVVEIKIFYDDGTYETFEKS